MSRSTPCTSCESPHRSKSGLCVNCRPAPKKPTRPERRCVGCGKRTTAAQGACMTCRRTTNKPGRQPGPVDTTTRFDRLALTGGTWHYTAGVWRWVSWNAA